MNKLLNEIKNELINYKNEELNNFEIIDNKLLFENEDNNFEIIASEDEVIVKYICKNEDLINEFNYELIDNKINDCNLKEWIDCLFGDIYDICMYDDDF
jgi:hypothetical protein